MTPPPISPLKISCSLRDIEFSASDPTFVLKIAIVDGLSQREAVYMKREDAVHLRGWLDALLAETK